MPKPLFSGQRLRHARSQLLWKGGQNLFAGDGYAGLSQMAMYAIGGILKHAPVASGDHEPHYNSYKRLVPGFEAPVNLPIRGGIEVRRFAFPLLQLAQGQAAGVPMP